MVQGRVGCERHVDVPQGVRRTVRGETTQPNDIVPDDATIDARIDRSVTTGRIVLPGGVMASIRSRKVHRYHRLTRYVLDQFLPHVPHRRTEHDRDRLVNVLPAGVSIIDVEEEEERQNDKTQEGRNSNIHTALTKDRAADGRREMLVQYNYTHIHSGHRSHALFGVRELRTYEISWSNPSIRLDVPSNVGWLHRRRQLPAGLERFEWVDNVLRKPRSHDNDSTAIDVARGRLDEQTFVDMLYRSAGLNLSRRNNLCKPAPPVGLTLKHVHYTPLDASK
jgi:hypothetical protein